jgi:hypothetical protein
MRLFAHKGYLIGFILSVVIFSILSLADLHHLRAPGDFNKGHEELACQECHQSADGSIRQQIQANLAYLIGNRDNLTAFNFEVPDNKDCLDCHKSEDDIHPVYRFNEPRFLEARKAIQPQYCVSCHKEHTGVRVSSSPENCQYCHKEIKVKDDPIDISHVDLIKLKNWDTCLTCHDFHGNHLMEVPTDTKDMIDKKLIIDYMKGGKDPYSDKKTAQSKETRYENESN